MASYAAAGSSDWAQADIAAGPSHAPLSTLAIGQPLDELGLGPGRVEALGLGELHELGLLERVEGDRTTGPSDLGQVPAAGSAEANDPQSESLHFRSSGTVRAAWRPRLRGWSRRTRPADLFSCLGE